jgi:hypothetical protein
MDAIRRKLRALGAVLDDSGVTEHERANALALKRNLEKKLKEEGAPNGDWTDVAFRTGRTIHHLKTVTASPASITETSSRAAFRVGKLLENGFKKWRSD